MKRLACVVYVTLLASMNLLIALAAPVSAAEGKARPQTLFTNCSVFDGKAEKLAMNRSVLVEGKLIKSIGDQSLKPVNDAGIVDCGGRTLMPGIIEAHGHVALPIGFNRLTGDEDLLYIGARAGAALSFFIDHGVTTVRDAGGPAYGIRKAVERGHVVGPRIYNSGMFVSQTSGHGDFRRFYDPHPNQLSEPPLFNRHFGHIADGVPEVRRAVREELRKGAVHIKLMAGGGQSSVYDPLHTVQYSQEELQAAVGAAADWGTYVMVHAYADAAVQRAVEAGVKVIEHGHLMTEETVKLMANKDVWWSPQAHFADPSDEASELILKQFGPVVQGKFLQVREGFATAVKYAKKYNLKVAWGTDAWGDNLNRLPLEWRMRSKYFSNHEQLVQATSLNGQLLALTGILNPYRDGPIGVIQEGAYADIILVEGDPLKNILLMQDPTNIALVMKDGKIYKNTLR